MSPVEGLRFAPPAAGRVSRGRPDRFREEETGRVENAGGAPRGDHRLTLPCGRREAHRGSIEGTARKAANDRGAIVAMGSRRGFRTTSVGD